MNTLYSRAEGLEKSLINLNIRSEGKISIFEAYQMPYLQREMYIKLYNEFSEEKRKAMQPNNE